VKRWIQAILEQPVSSASTPETAAAQRMLREAHEATARGEIPLALDKLEAATQAAHRLDETELMLVCRDLADELEWIATGSDLKRAVHIADATRT
jgi:hypothetical protein